MPRIRVCLTLAILSSALLRAPVGAQVLPGNDVGSVGVQVGLLAPQTKYTDASFGQSWFESGFAVSATATVWPTRGNWGFRAQLTRSRTDGTNASFPLAPIAVNDPTQFLLTGEFAIRRPVDFGSLVGVPYLSAGVGAKQYNWAVSVHQEDRSFLWTVGLGTEVRHGLLGPFALTLDGRAYFSKFKSFGIDDGTWEPGFYGGTVGGVATRDFLFSSGLSFVF
jgi:hypothetical protein